MLNNQWMEDKLLWAKNGVTYDQTVAPLANRWERDSCLRELGGVLSGYGPMPANRHYPEEKARH